ncbi:MAG: hypothetical protein WKF47_01830 [Geodermatophilaceae bacterium]
MGADPIADVTADRQGGLPPALVPIARPQPDGIDLPLDERPD